MADDVVTRSLGHSPSRSLRARVSHYHGVHNFSPLAVKLLQSLRGSAQVQSADEELVALRTSMAGGLSNS